MPPRRKKPSRRPKHQRFILDTDMYPSIYYVQLGGEANEALAWYADKVGLAPPPNENDRGSLGKFWATENSPGGAIWVHANAPACIIAHECLHATFHTLDCLGFTLSEASEEAYCYLLAWLLDEIVKRGR